MGNRQRYLMGMTTRGQQTLRLVRAEHIVV